MSERIDPDWFVECSNYDIESEPLGKCQEGGGDGMIEIVEDDKVIGYLCLHHLLMFIKDHDAVIAETKLQEDGSYLMVFEWRQ